MAKEAQSSGGRRGGRGRSAVWGAAALLGLLPLAAMQFTDEVNWDETDFILFGAMLAAACGTFELAARMTDNRAYRGAVGVAAVAAFLLVWINLAVGIIGSEDNPANLMYGGVLAVAIVGGAIARFQSPGMARVLVATALAQALVGAVALIGGLGAAEGNWPAPVVGLTAFFALLWLAAALLFRLAAAKQAPAGAAR